MLSSRLQIACGLAAVVAVVSVQSANAQDTQSPAPVALPAASPAPCRIVQAKLASPLNSGSARNGTVFQFAVDGSEAGTPMTGYGIVDFVTGAGRGGKPGEIGLQARYASMPDGTHVPATIIPDARGTGHSSGNSRNMPAMLRPLSFFKGTGFGIANGVVSVFGFAHSGSQAVVPAGTPLRIVLGDDYLTGACSLT